MPSRCNGEMSGEYGSLWMERTALTRWNFHRTGDRMQDSLLVEITLSLEIASPCIWLAPLNGIEPVLISSQSPFDSLSDSFYVHPQAYFEFPSYLNARPNKILVSEPLSALSGLTLESRSPKRTISENKFECKQKTADWGLTIKTV